MGTLVGLLGTVEGHCEGVRVGELDDGVEVTGYNDGANDGERVGAIEGIIDGEFVGV